MPQNIDDGRTDGRHLNGERCEGRLMSFPFPQGPLVRCDRLIQVLELQDLFNSLFPAKEKFRSDGL